MFKKNDKHQDESFTDIQNPLNDSSRIGLVSKGKNGSKNSKYQNESGPPKVENQNFDEMFDTNQESSVGKKRGSMASQLNDGDHENNGPKSIPNNPPYH